MIENDIAVSINDVTVAENVAGGVASFTVSLSSASTLPVTVDVATTDGSAVTPDDYTAIPLTTLTFAPGETSKTVDVNVVDDALIETNEAFTVSLSNPSNATLGTAVGTGTLTDDELPPAVSVNDRNGSREYRGWSCQLHGEPVRGEHPAGDSGCGHGERQRGNAG